MSLLLKTLIISSMMILLCSLPLLFSQMKKVSRLLFLVGTGALVGICCFDLMPDVIELGGNSSLLLVFSVWIVYSAIHLLHYRHHKLESLKQNHSHTDDPLHSHSQGMAMFLTSMIVHCVSSGVLLAMSMRFSGKFSHAVFFALVAHKSYESLIVSSVIVERTKTKLSAFYGIVAYALALPLGVIVASLFDDQITMKLAISATSFALGTLLGCMVFDFIIPSVTQIRKKRLELGWIVAGLALTEFVMRNHT
jgi:zinc transporter ZupT